MGWDAPSHWVIIAVVVIVLFGYKKLPDAAKAVGRSLRAFKTELKGEDGTSGDDPKAVDAAQPVEPNPAANPASSATGQAGTEPSTDNQPVKQGE